MGKDAMGYTAPLILAYLLILPLGVKNITANTQQEFKSLSTWDRLPPQRIYLPS